MSARKRHHDTHVATTNYDKDMEHVQPMTLWEKSKTHYSKSLRFTRHDSACLDMRTSTATKLFCLSMSMVGITFSTTSMFWDQLVKYAFADIIPPAFQNLDTLSQFETQLRRLFETEDRNTQLNSEVTDLVDNYFGNAFHQSYGLFDDIPNFTWQMMKMRYKQTPHHTNPNEPMHGGEHAAGWYQMNWEPTFTCPNERRIGGMGVGAKWVCEPHRLPALSGKWGEFAPKDDENPKKRNHKVNGCLVYSIGIEGKLSFEEGIQEAMGNECEIHIFDPVKYSDTMPKEMNFHPWGLESSDILKNAPRGEYAKYKSLQQTIRALGHENRIIDILKVDCKACEWGIYQDWFTSNVDIRQILVKVHQVPSNANNFFRRIDEEGYVTFHKEPDIQYEGGNCVEYAFLKLAPEFFGRESKGTLSW